MGTRTLAALLGGLGLLLALLLPAAPRAAPSGPAGMVTFVSGEATRAAGGRSERLAVGAHVHEGDVLETRRRTRLEVRLADGSALRLGPLSRAALSRATSGEAVEARQVSVRLLLGKIWANVARAVGGEARFEVVTENAVAGVRGTTFRVDAARDRSVIVKVYRGTVAVGGRGPIPRPAHAGAPPARRRIDGPRQISREQWERIVTRMMQVRVSAAGVPGEPEAFALAGAGDGWEAWNRGRDAVQ